jgi:hypothetical protein
MKLKSFLFVTFFSIGMAFSNANPTTNNVNAENVVTELYAEFTEVSIIDVSTFDDCEWYSVTTITTTTTFFLGYPVLVHITTKTTLECR